ncbi:hypothetical protein ATE80_02640 [Streptomyces kanasensis]|uniref:Uncharacterized protein n=1 Tax=Streptomyces kanasensis TaxID=936756 RepID=A0A100Y9G9_9ACTN|nr:hypothetical protein ATE80_02640 [Streptomyces kanasensis]
MIAAARPAPTRERATGRTTGPHAGLHAGLHRPAPPGIAGVRRRGRWHAWTVAPEQWRAGRWHAW